MGQILSADRIVLGGCDEGISLPTQEALGIWYIDQKTSEDGEQVLWELSSPGEIDNHGFTWQADDDLLPWTMTGGYRGANCGYTGAVMFDDDDNPAHDPSKDQCKGGLKSCKLRFGQNNELNHGGFPAVSLIARS